MPVFTGKITDGMNVNGFDITSKIPIAGKNIKISGNNIKPGGGFEIVGVSSNVEVSANQCNGVEILVNLSTGNLPFDGKKYLIEDLNIDSNVTDGGKLLQGNWGTYSDANYARRVIVQRNKTNTNKEGLLVLGAGLFLIDIHGNSYICSVVPVNSDLGDSGIFQINGGNGKIRENYRRGGWAWLSRFFGAVVKGGDIADVEIFNNIDLLHTTYGGIEMRIETAGQLGQHLQGTNLRADNNTCGNYNDSGVYSNNSVLIMAMDTAYQCEIQSNILFNAKNHTYHDIGGGVGTQNNYQPTLAKNNVYYNSATEAGFADDTLCVLLPSSKLIDAGVTTKYPTDIAGIVRPQGKAFDIGAREFVFATPPPNQAPIANAGGDQTITLPVNQVILDGSASHDPDGKIVSWAWSQTSGPNKSVITNGNTPQATISGLIAGSYGFNLAVTDNQGAVSNSPVNVIVKAPVKYIVKVTQTTYYSDGSTSTSVLQ